MPPEPSVGAITGDDLAALANLGIDKTRALRAMAQNMAWKLQQGSLALQGAATAYLADGTVFIDGLAGDQPARERLIDHVIAYARWSYAPAVTLFAPANIDPLEARGFIGLDQKGLPPELAKAAGDRKLLMKRL